MASDVENDLPVPDPEKKYIRTFAGDMAVAEQGGTPDLAPYVEPAPTPEVALAVTPPVALEPVPAAAPRPPVVPMGWNDAAREAAIERLHEKMAEDEAKGVVRVTAHEAPIGLEPKTEEKVSPLQHTYEDDFSTRVKSEQASTLSVLAAEQDAGPHEGEVVTASRISMIVYAAVGTLLLVGGSVGGYFGYQSYVAGQAVAEVPVTIEAPIFVDERSEVVGQGPALREAMLAKVSAPLLSNAVRFLYSTNATTTRDSLFVTAKIVAPSILTRNIVGARSMAGVIAAGGGQNMFFILGVSSYNETFGGMLAWERTMAADIAAFFAPFPEPVVVPPVVATTTATSSSAGTKAKNTTAASTTTVVPVAPVRVAQFTDAVVADHDVRVYTDAQGHVVFLYGYWDPETLVIARNTAAFAELVGRLAHAHQSR